MRSFIGQEKFGQLWRGIAGLVMLCITLGALPIVAVADDFPPDCIPDPYFEYEQTPFEGKIYTYLRYNPRISVDCPMFVGDLPIEDFVVLHVQNKVERLNPNTGDVVTVFATGYESQIVAGQDFGGAYYSIGGGVNITGETVGEYYHYRLVVNIWWAEDLEGLASSFASDWVPGPDHVRVNDDFDDRPGGFVPLPGNRP